MIRFYLGCWFIGLGGYISGRFCFEHPVMIVPVLLLLVGGALTLLEWKGR